MSAPEVRLRSSLPVEADHRIAAECRPSHRVPAARLVQRAAVNARERIRSPSPEKEGGMKQRQPVHQFLPENGSSEVCATLAEDRLNAFAKQNFHSAGEVVREKDS